MKKLGTVVLAASSAALSWAQAPPFQFIQVDYMKVAPGKGSEYVRLERELFKPIHADRVNNGKIVSWNLWAVRLPGGSGAPYGYATSTGFANFAAMESSYQGTDVAKIHPNLAQGELGARASAARDLVRSDVLSVVAATEGEPKSRKYATVHFHKATPGKGGDYVRALREYWKPLHDQLVTSGKITGWVATAVRYPGGSRRPHDFVTVMFYDSFAAIENPYQGADTALMKEAVARSEPARQTVRTELWTLLDRLSK